MSEPPAKKGEAWRLLYKEDHRYRQTLGRHDDGYCILCGRPEEEHTRKEDE